MTEKWLVDIFAIRVGLKKGKGGGAALAFKLLEHALKPAHAAVRCHHYAVQ